MAMSLFNVVLKFPGIVVSSYNIEAGEGAMAFEAGQYFNKSTPCVDEAKGNITKRLLGKANSFVFSPTLYCI